MCVCVCGGGGGVFTPGGAIFGFSFSLLSHAVSGTSLDR